MVSVAESAWAAAPEAHATIPTMASFMAAPIQSCARRARAQHPPSSVDATEHDSLNKSNLSILRPRSPCSDIPDASDRPRGIGHYNHHRAAAPESIANRDATSGRFGVGRALLGVRRLEPKKKPAPKRRGFRFLKA